MKNIISIFFAVLMVLSFPMIACSTVIDFEAVTSESRANIYDGYFGFNWDNFGVIEKGLRTPHYDTGIVSGNYGAYNTSSNVATMDDSIFMFDGVYLTAANYYRTSPLQIIVTGFLNGSPIVTESVSAPSDSALWCDFSNFDNVWIDALSFGASQQFVMDDFTYTPAPVPEPATISLLLSGIGFMGVYFRRNRNKQL